MSFFFSRSSEQRLSTVHTDLRRVCRRALAFEVMDFSVLEGHREKEKQNAAFDAGLSQVKWPDGKHNRTPALAVDLAPYPLDWKDKGRFILLAGVMFVAAALENVNIRWGGDWNMDGFQRDEKFRDFGHFEILI